MTSRGKNFTEREKCKLMELVQKYKDIIENECTNAVSMLKKNEAWESITTEFNSAAEIPRTLKQLNTAYLNMKRTTRQNIASENIKKYLELTQNTSSTFSDEPNIYPEVEVQSILKQLKKDDITDKKGVMATGGGVHKPVLSNVGAQVLSLMGDQVKPLPNSCDSASNYFFNDGNVTCQVLPFDNLLQSSSLEKYKCTPSVTSIAVSQSSSSQNSSKTLPITKTAEVRKKRKMSQKNKNSNIKEGLLSKKLQCVILEKKTKLLEYEINLKKNKLLDLELKIKQYEYDSLKK